AVEHDRRGRLADRGAHTELEEAAADVRRRLEMTVPVLVGVAHVNDYDLFPRGQAPPDVGRPLLRDDLPCLAQPVLQPLHGLDLNITAIPGRFKGDEKSTTFLQPIRRCYTHRIP